MAAHGTAPAISLPWPAPDPAVVERLRSAPTVAVIPHILPDVDALASAEGLCLTLRAIGHEAWAHVPELPDIYSWALDPSLRRTDAPDAGALRVAVDTARPDRLQLPGPVAVNIDHHEDNPGFAPVNWVRSAPACSCLLAPLAGALGVPVTGPLATALFRGLVGDSEGFRAQAEPETFAWAAHLAACGADTVASLEAFAQRSPGFWAYLAEVEGAGHVLAGDVPLHVFPIPRDLPGRFALRPYEAALLPSHLTAPAGGILAILQEGERGVRFRLRSRGVDVLPLAHRLGGGGHPQAAGVQMAGARLGDAEAALRHAWELEATALKALSAVRAPSR